MKDILESWWRKDLRIYAPTVTAIIHPLLCGAGEMRLKDREGGGYDSNTQGMTDFVREYEPSRPVTFALHPYHIPEQINLSVEERVKLTMKMQNM